jgi:hypothetical protein
MLARVATWDGRGGGEEMQQAHIECDDKQAMETYQQVVKCCKKATDQLCCCLVEWDEEEMEGWERRRGFRAVWHSLAQILGREADARRGKASWMV